MQPLVRCHWSVLIAWPFQQEKEALDDLNMELELADEDQLVLCVSSCLFCEQPFVDPNFRRYRVGEAFVHLRHGQAMKRLERDQNDLTRQLDGLKEKTEECEKEMKELKVTLYAKFGRAINLDE